MIIFSDLDGTLLDHETFSFGPALQALEILAKARIPLIFCTSKTRAETEYWRQRMNNHYPFIVENGGAIYIPFNYFSFSLSQALNRDKYRVIELGERYERLRRFLTSCRQKYDPTLRGFGDMSLEEIASLAGISPEMAAFAQKREYDEPFIFGQKRILLKLKKEAAKNGLKILGGSRFYHLTGNSDKGKAFKILKKLYIQHLDRVTTVAIGDSQNDEAMLKRADIAFLVQRPDRTYDDRIKIKKIIHVPEIGPAGWNQAILSLLA